MEIHLVAILQKFWLIGGNFVRESYKNCKIYIFQIRQRRSVQLSYLKDGWVVMKIALFDQFNLNWHA